MTRSFDPRIRRPGLIALAAGMLAAITLVQPGALIAQAPDTDIFLAGLIIVSDDSLGLEAPLNITSRVGYDNQPQFTADGQAILYTSDRDGQTDIFRYSLTGARTERVTDTPESEYSATPIPGSDAFSVIRVEADSAQRLWSFRADGSEPTLLFPEIAPVGYHAWSDESAAAMFVLGQPPTLQFASLGGRETRIIAESVGRSIHRIPGTDRISFVHKRGEGDWWITALDPGSGELQPLIATLPGAEDYAWLRDGRVLMGQGSVLYVARPGVTDWTAVEDLSLAGLGDITRLAVGGTRPHLAIVAQPAPPR